MKCFNPDVDALHTTAITNGKLLGFMPFPAFSATFPAFRHFPPLFREPQKSPNVQQRAGRHKETAKVETEIKEKENFVITLKLVNCRTDIPLLPLQLFLLFSASFSLVCLCICVDTNYINLIGILCWEIYTYFMQIGLGLPKFLIRNYGYPFYIF